MNDKVLSSDRQRYLRKNRLEKITIYVTQILIVLLFIAIWELLANFKIIDSFITSQPSRIFDTFIHLSSNDLLKHLGITFYETILGFLLGTFLGLIIAIILWLSKFLSKVFDPFLVVLNSLPKVALGPIIILTKRPAKIKNIYNIDFEMENRMPITCMKSPKFSGYFDSLWKELDVHE